MHKKKGKSKYAKQCVHQALLIQYCRQLGKDGISVFFKRVTTKGNQANDVFTNDVNRTFESIKTRALALANEPDEGDVEQIQLHAVDPNTEISINIPPPLPANLEDVPPDMIEARKIFETFPPGLQRALESGKLDDVNVVLGKMSLSEAEEVVEQLGNSGMLNLENKVIDATTTEGKKVVEEIERTHKMPIDRMPEVMEVEEPQPQLLEDTVD